MLRWLALPLSIALSFTAGPGAAQDLDAHAAAMTAALKNLADGNAAEAREKLSAIPDSLKGVEYRLLARLAASPEPVLTGQPVPKPNTRCLLAVLHPSQPLVAYVCDKGQVTVFDLAHPEQAPRNLTASRGKPLMNGCFSADGSRLAAGDTAGGVTWWNTNDWKEIASQAKGDAPVRYLALNRDGSKLLAETKDGVVLWDVERNQEIAKVGDRYRFGSALAFSDAGMVGATGGLAQVRIFDLDSGELVREMKHAPYTMHLAFSQDGKYVASGLRGSLNKWLGVFEVDSGKVVFDRARHQKGVTGLAFVDQGSRLLSSSSDGTLRVWHVPSGKLLLGLPLGGSIYQLFAHHDGAWILWNSRGGPRYFNLSE